MRVVCDIEADSLQPTKVWCIVCKDIDNGDVTSFSGSTLGDFVGYSTHVDLWIGHNFLDYDLWALNRLVEGCAIDPSRVVDTLVVSRLHDFRRAGGHSLKAYGDSYGYPKVEHEDWSQFSPEMLHRCQVDVEINHKVWLEHYDFINDPANRRALRCEHDIAYVCKEIHNNGFYFDIDGAREIYSELSSELEGLLGDIRTAFSPRAAPIREVYPRTTKSGSLHAGDFRWVQDGDLTPFSPGSPFTRIDWRDFNPGSPKQVVERFNDFGWTPYVKTDGFVDADRELRTLSREVNSNKSFLPLGRLIELRSRITELQDKLREYETYGWKICEENLATLPDTAPSEAFQLIQWKLLEKRRQTLEEWFSAYKEETHRIHGNFNGIGTWTHRMSHNSPNMGNVPSIDSKYNSPELKEKARHYGIQLRSRWQSQPGRRLVGVDAEGIQLRVLGHYIDDRDFINALVNGDKKKGTDEHTLNAIKLGLGPEGRPAAKTFIYAWLLGAGIPKIAKILDVTIDQARQATESFLDGYPGLRHLKEVVIPQDVYNGYFLGVDGRKIPCDNDHLMLAGYLQNGEALVMKYATLKWRAQLNKERVPYWLVDYVHDEWQTETLDDEDLCNYIADVQINSIVKVGEELGLRCPLAGSKSIGSNWYETH